MLTKFGHPQFHNPFTEEKEAQCAGKYHESRSRPFDHLTASQSAVGEIIFREYILYTYVFKTHRPPGLVV